MSTYDFHHSLSSLRASARSLPTESVSSAYATTTIRVPSSMSFSLCGTVLSPWEYYELAWMTTVGSERVIISAERRRIVGPARAIVGGLEQIYKISQETSDQSSKPIPDGSWLMWILNKRSHGLSHTSAETRSTFKPVNLETYTLPFAASCGATTSLGLGMWHETKSLLTEAGFTEPTPTGTLLSAAGMALITTASQQLSRAIST